MVIVRSLSLSIVIKGPPLPGAISQVSLFDQMQFVYFSSDELIFLMRERERERESTGGISNPCIQQKACYGIISAALLGPDHVARHRCVLVWVVTSQ